MLCPIILALLLLYTLSGSLDASFPGPSSENKKPLSSIPKLNIQHHIDTYRNAERRLFLLDSDDTLRVSNMNLVGIKGILTQLAQSKKNEVIIISARSIDNLKRTYGTLRGVLFAGEHGLVTYDAENDQTTIRQGLPSMDKLKQICQQVIGVEDPEDPYEWKYHVNEATMTISYKRDVNRVERASAIAQQIRAELEKELKDEDAKSVKNPYHDFQVMHLNERYVINFTPPNADKGTYARSLLEKKDRKYDFVMSMGDEAPDEPMHEAVNDHGGLSVIVNSNQNKMSSALFKLDNVDAVHDVLGTLASRTL